MKTISLKFLLLACLVFVIFRQNLAAGIPCKNNYYCEKICGGYCPIIGTCMCPHLYNLNAINIASSNDPCIPEHPGCRGGPPPKQLKV
ncbi:hypothetical protein N665_0625s0011 [Sinapis alba]|nr:hypothetical protein N665_0625s0011 [Sinapis alba]